MAKSFESFLARHRQAVIDQFRPRVQISIPSLTTQEEIVAATTKLVDFFYGRMLGTLTIDSPLVQNLLKAALESKTSRENMATNRKVLFEILERLCATDTTLNQHEQEHIQRMLGQSKNFLAADVAIVNPQNVKKPPAQ